MVQNKRKALKLELELEDNHWEPILFHRFTLIPYSFTFYILLYIIALYDHEGLNNPLLGSFPPYSLDVKTLTIYLILLLVALFLLMFISMYLV